MDSIPSDDVVAEWIRELTEEQKLLFLDYLRQLQDLHKEGA